MCGCILESARSNSQGIPRTTRSTLAKLPEMHSFLAAQERRQQRKANRRSVFEKAAWLSWPIDLCSRDSQQGTHGARVQFARTILSNCVLADRYRSDIFPAPSASRGDIHIEPKSSSFGATSPPTMKKRVKYSRGAEIDTQSAVAAQRKKTGPRDFSGDSWSSR